MKETFTNRAKKALQNAQNEAKLLRHRTVGTEHLLLGLITEQDGIAGKTLRETSLTAEDVRDEIEHLVDYGPMSKNDDSTHEDVILPYSPRSRQVMAYAADEARRLNSPLVGTEHILLGVTINIIIFFSLIDCKISNKLIWFIIKSPFPIHVVLLIHNPFNVDPAIFTIFRCFFAEIF